MRWTYLALLLIPGLATSEPEICRGEETVLPVTSPWYPSKVGTSLRFKVTEPGKQPYEIDWTVARIWSFDGLAVVIQEGHAKGQETLNEFYTITQKGIHLVRTYDGKVVAGIPFVLLPLKVGEERAVVEEFGAKISATWTTTEATVKVPAGEFDAMACTILIPRSYATKQETKTTRWIVKNIGTVKREIEIDGMWAGTMELVGFSLGTTPTPSEPAVENPLVTHTQNVTFCKQISEAQSVAIKEHAKLSKYWILDTPATLKCEKDLVASLRKIEESPGDVDPELLKAFKNYVVAYDAAMKNVKSFEDFEDRLLMKVAPAAVLVQIDPKTGLARFKEVMSSIPNGSELLNITNYSILELKSYAIKFNETAEAIEKRDGVSLDKIELALRHRKGADIFLTAEKMNSWSKKVIEDALNDEKNKKWKR